MKPHIAINFACSLDGKISSSDRKEFKFSNMEDLTRVHRMRSESDIILVGKNTINTDDPKLIVSNKYYKSDHLPDVGILDSSLRVRKESRVFSYPRSVIMFCGINAEEEKFTIDSESRVIVRRSHDPTPNTSYVIRELEKMDYRRVMIEGGKSVLTSFIEEDNWDEISIFYSPVLIGETGISMVGLISKPLRFLTPTISKLGNGFLVTIKKEF